MSTITSSVLKTMQFAHISSQLSAPSVQETTPDPQMEKNSMKAFSELYSTKKYIIYKY